MAFLRWRWVRIALGLSVLFGLAAVVGGFAFYWTFLRDLPDLRTLDDYRPPLASHVFDREERPIGAYFTERRVLTPFEEVPKHVVDAFVAGEDSAFFEHAGIDYQSILRAAWVNLRAGGDKVQGGSTITQQMVKGLLLTPERTYRRKIREMILARDIEQVFSKQEILYLYLNQIYFGHGAYGIGEAARTYFGKDVGELSVSEGAQLAGLPKAPSRYSPYANPEQAESRRQYVLSRMLEEELIDRATYDEAVAEIPALQPTDEEDGVDAAAYFVEEVRRKLYEELGSDLVLRGGLTIETTLDIEAQRAAVAALRQGLEDLDRRQGYRGPIRRVERDAIEDELARLAVENGFVEEPDPDEESEAASDIESEPPDDGTEIALDAGKPAQPARSEPQASEVMELEPRDTPYTGVVTEVDAEAKLASVGFAPGVEAVVHLADVSWARKPNPKQAPHKVRAIGSVFRVGDVARFFALPPDGDAERDDTADDAHEPVRVTLYQEPIVQGALLSLDVASGDVLAMVGGYDYDESQFNRAIQARRQPGSAFKPLIYAAALEDGYTPASILYDRPVVYTDERSGFTWRPQNYGRSFYGPITLRSSLVRSVNNATVHLFRDVGPGRVIEFARKLGLEAPLERDLSLALGSSSVSLLELTRAYAVFPARGRRVIPRFIRRVTDREGNVLLEDVELGSLEEPESEESEAEAAPRDPDLVDVVSEDDEPSWREGEQILTPQQAYLVTDLLRAVVTDADGTGWRLRALRRPVAGKTGTTNDQGDAWFMGFSPEIATGVWVGHDSTRYLGWGETGSRAAAPVWVDYMREALRKRPVRDFTVPNEIVFARIDRKTGLLADASTEEAVFQSFLAGTEPTERSNTARAESESRQLLRLEAF